MRETSSGPGRFLQPRPRRKPRPLVALAFLGAATLVAAFVPACDDDAVEEAVPYNVLLLTVDTLRPDYLSFNGYDRPTSPFLDSLLAESFYFDEAVAPIARTTPALASLLTGAYPHRTGVRTLMSKLDTGIGLVTEALHAEGYQTMATVTNWVLARGQGLDGGFEQFSAMHDSRDARETTDRAVEMLEGRDPARPAFLWVHYIDPHAPYHPDSTVAANFDPGYRGRYKERFGNRLGPIGGHRLGPDSPDRFRAFPADLPKKTAVYSNPLPEEVNAHIRRLYAANIRFMDDELRRLLDAMRATCGSEFIVVFTADHGESLGEHDFYFDHGDYVYNAGTRVPLAFALPASHPLCGRQRIQGWVSLVDVVPTLFALLGRDLPDTMSDQVEGRSLVPALRGKPLSPAPVFAESGKARFEDLVRRRVRFDVSGRFRSVIRDGWKLIWTPFREADGQWELYDLKEDPNETTDLYREDHPQFETLRNALSEWMASGSGAGDDPAGLQSDDLEVLRALGYVD